MSTEIHSTERFRARFGGNSGRVRRLTSFAIVALLSLALWAAIIGVFVALWR
jgi:hypothetical protein